MMHVQRSINRSKSVKVIRINRWLRDFSEYLYLTIIICSIGLSSFVIYTKNNKLATFATFGIEIAKILAHAGNVIDNALLNPKKVRINKLKYLSEEEIFDIVKQNLTIDYNTSATHNIYQEIMKIPLVRSAKIIRRPFRSIEIHIQEVKVVATLKDQISGNFYLIDHLGNAIMNNKPHFDTDIFAKIESSSMDDLEFYYTTYSTLQSCPKLAEQIITYTNISRSRWDLHLKNGCKIMLPIELNSDAVDKLCSIGSEKLDLFSQNSTIEYIDARIKDRIYYKLRAI